VSALQQRDIPGELACFFVPTGLLYFADHLRVCVCVLLVAQSNVDYAQLLPTDQIRLVTVISSSQTRPNNLWWQRFLACLQDSFPSYSPNQLVMLLRPILEMSGRPPQAWLAAHESALLTANRHSREMLSSDGWLALLNCYSCLMYQPSEEFEGIFERYIFGALPSLGAWGLASLVGSVARLQMPRSAQLEEGIVERLEQVGCAAWRSGSAEICLALGICLPSWPYVCVCGFMAGIMYMSAFRGEVVGLLGGMCCWQGRVEVRSSSTAVRVFCSHSADLSHGAVGGAVCY